jgi:hypothetical protein
VRPISCQRASGSKCRRQAVDISFLHSLCTVDITQYSVGLQSFRRRVPKEIAHGGYPTNVRVKVLGEILEIASFVATPVGAVLAVAALVGAYFYGRWVLSN